MRALYGWVILLLAVNLQAGTAKKVLGYVRVLEKTPIYHGADLNAKVEATALKGQVYELTHATLIHGFYRIDYNGHMSYIHAGAVQLVDERGAPMPTVAPTAAPTIAPTAAPTVAPTAVSTVAPTADPTVAPTADPTVAPTADPTVAPTADPTVALTADPTVALTAAPTSRPTAVLTVAPTPESTPIPGVQTPATAQGKRRRIATAQKPSRSALGRAGSAISFGSSLAGDIQIRRPAGHLNGAEITLPLGTGKHETLVQPPYKQHAGMQDQRPVDFSGFAGLGLQVRLADPVRLHFDWLAHSHRTKAADLGIPALKVGVPGSPATTTFNESDAFYRMNSHQFRVGLKLSLPHPVVEPWVGGTYGLWVWNAELAALNREIGYGDDFGVAFGGTLGVGIDFHGSFAGGLGWSVTPFVEWGAPTVHPTFKDIAGLGVDWKDSFGTPVATHARMGVQLGIGF